MHNATVWEKDEMDDTEETMTTQSVSESQHTKASTGGA